MIILFYSITYFIWDIIFRNSNPDSCLIFKLETETYWHIDYVVFDSIINGGHPNPIQIPIDNWKVRFLCITDLELICVVVPRILCSTQIFF